MATMNRQRGKIVHDPHINVWPHERKTAEALADAGYTVEFIKRSEEKRQTSADLLIDGVVWEMKAPKSGTHKAIDRNLRRATGQASHVIIDSRRMKNAKDEVVERELRKGLSQVKAIKAILFVNRKGEVIDIR